MGTRHLLCPGGGLEGGWGQGYFSAAGAHPDVRNSSFWEGSRVWLWRRVRGSFPSLVAGEAPGEAIRADRDQEQCDQAAPGVIINGC